MVQVIKIDFIDTNKKKISRSNIIMMGILGALALKNGDIGQFAINYLSATFFVKCGECVGLGVMRVLK